MCPAALARPAFRDQQGRCAASTQDRNLNLHVFAGNIKPNLGKHDFVRHADNPNCVYVTDNAAHKEQPGRKPHKVSCRLPTTTKIRQ